MVVGGGGGGVAGRQKIFRPFGPQFGLEISGRGAVPPGPLPWNRHWIDPGVATLSTYDEG